MLIWVRRLLRSTKTLPTVPCHNHIGFPVYQRHSLDPLASLDGRFGFRLRHGVGEDANQVLERDNKCIDSILMAHRGHLPLVLSDPRLIPGSNQFVISGAIILPDLVRL